MSSEEEDAVEGQSRSHLLMGRTILFLVINGPTTVLTLGMWIRMGARMSKHTASVGDNRTFMLMLAIWFIGIIGSAVAIFKK